MNLDTMFHIKEKYWYQVISWAQLAYDEDKNEISGLATAIPNSKGQYWIDNIEIMKQENTGTNTELDGDAVAAYMMKYGMKYNNPDMKFVWWHSHHTMEAFWSGTDEKEINAWQNNSFSLALVVNLKEEYKFRVSVWKAGNLDLEQHYDIPLHICRDNGVLITDKMKKEYEDFCEDKQTYIGYGTTYKNGKVVSNQSNLWNNPSTIDHNKRTVYKDVLNRIDELNSDFIEGKITLKKWTNVMKKLSKKYSNNDYEITFPVGSKQDIMDLLMCMTPDELIEFRTVQLENSYTMGEGWFTGYGWH